MKQLNLKVLVPMYFEDNLEDIFERANGLGMDSLTEDEQYFMDNYHRLFDFMDKLSPAEVEELENATDNDELYNKYSNAEMKLKEIESDCIDKLDTDENNEDIIYEANCPKCNYDMFEIYDKVCNGSKSKYCKITNIHSGSCGDFYGTDWNVECTCPKCKTKFTFSDEDYETFGLKFNDGLSVKENRE